MSVKEGANTSSHGPIGNQTSDANYFLHLSIKAAGPGLENAFGAKSTRLSFLFCPHGGSELQDTAERMTDAFFYTTVLQIQRKKNTSRFYPIHGTRLTSHVTECLLDVCFLDSTFQKSLFSSSVSATIHGQDKQPLHQTIQSSL
ncbi:unnamed protein product [Arctogadus glacialis]